MNTPEDALDALETQLLMLMEADSVDNFKPGTRRLGKDTYAEANPDDSKVVEARTPQAPLIVLDHSRLFTPRHDLLLQPVDKLIGDYCEVALLLHDTDKPMIKWLAFERVKLPKRYLCVGPSDSIIYAVHYRYSTPEGYGRYTRKLVAWSPSTRRPYGVGQSNRNIDSLFLRGISTQFCLVASITEDANFFWQVKVTDGKSLTLYTDETALKDLAALRDGPRTSTDRRKPIMHWVKGHARRIAVSQSINVIGHLRGITQFSLESFQFDIRKPFKDDRDYEALVADRKAYEDLQREQLLPQNET